MICDCCKKEFDYEDDILCENGYLYHKDCEDKFNPYGRKKENKLGDKVYIVWAIKIEQGPTGRVLEIPWIYGVFKDEEKACFVQNYMQNSKEYGHLYWGNDIKIIK